MSSQGQGCQLQADDPALCAPVQGRDLLGLEMQVHRLVEQRRRFVGRELQIRCPDLEQLAVGAQAGQREGRIDAGDQDKVQVGRLVVQQIAQALVDLFRLG